MKRFFSLCIAIVLFVGLMTACGQTETPVSDTDNDTVITTTNDRQTEETEDMEQTENTTTKADEVETDVTTKGKGTRPKTTTRAKKTTATPTTTTQGTTAPTTARPTVATVKKNYATDRKLKVACVGDSVTAGGYWQSNLRGELSASNYEVKGFGKSGATALFKGVDYVDSKTNGPKAFKDQSAYTESLAYGADVVVIMLGTNDSKEVNWPYYGNDFTDNYIELIKSYQNSPSNPMVFVALPPTAYAKAKNFQGISDKVITENIIPELYVAAAATGAIVIDTHTATAGDESMVKDGVHPSEKGKAVLCETIAKAIIRDTGRE